MMGLEAFVLAFVYDNSGIVMSVGKHPHPFRT